ncbi:hypothetical protein SAMN04488570_2827 [Nocardioides scoriae]|uniref:ABC-2 type transporter transmembrane domain-containing protein n=1 Tax=Nocardioides scoriae TaxID=642780 RepID=A0A1H1VIR2_9ACTN|nr:ABC transporter permease [Nocardioides scoriae]SDS83969.1 hypothetical protein SAMN04488570_2827 [Nocardioides scoriae]
MAQTSPEAGKSQTADTFTSDPGAARSTARSLRRTVVGVLLIGAVVQVVLIMYYMGAVHSPRPRDLPVGVVANSAQRADVTAQIEAGGDYDARQYDSADELSRAVESKAVYGGVDVSSSSPELFVASAAGPSAATALRTAFTTVVTQERARQVEEIAAADTPVSPSTLAAFSTPAKVTDLVPLPAADRGGSALGLLVQVLAIGATVASTALGRLGPRTARSPMRGVAHVSILLAYAFLSAAAVSLGASIFGVIPSGELWSLLGAFALLSLAMTASVAAAVALLGPVGANLGTLYFLVGVVVSGASVIPEFLPDWARVLGQGLPTGAGASLVRERLYFPDASVAGPATVLVIYALVGVAVVMMTNTLPGRVRRNPQEVPA